MSLIDTPLTDQEIDELNRFLLERIPEEEAESASEETDEGVLDISELDGFLTAIVCSPKSLLPADWMPVLWGDFERQWASLDASERMITMVLRHLNAIVATLNDAPADFEPIVLEVEEEGALVTSVEEWCLGFMKGVSLSTAAWQEGGEEVMDLLFPIMVFTTAEGHSSLERLDADELETLKLSLPASVRKLHSFWLARGGSAEGHSALLHDEAQVGRNDPCVCGSGKKFKKCCLH